MLPHEFSVLVKLGFEVAWNEPSKVCIRLGIASPTPWGRLAQEVPLRWGKNPECLPQPEIYMEFVTKLSMAFHDAGVSSIKQKSLMGLSLGGIAAAALAFHSPWDNVP